MRHVLPLLAVATTSALMLGCQGGSPVAPTDAVDAVGTAGLGQTLLSDAAQLGALGLYDVSLDASSLSATVTLRETRHAQENDDVYLLAIDGFLRPDSFKLLTIARMPDPEFVGGTWDRPRLELLWEFSHPFPSSGTIPRADLGFSGIACFLFDVDTATGHSYFTGDADVVLNESLMLYSDGYFQPRALLDLTGYSANTFPYQSLVDDGGGDIGGGNRFVTGSGMPIDNFGNPRGNFGGIGWQTGSSDTWTGYDVLHQGQSVRRKLILDLAAVEAAGSIDFTVAIFDKYVDPKSATPGFEHRLPADPPDVLGEFGYRYPHGCWDVSHVRMIGETRGLIADKESVTTLRLQVRDWDARAETSGETDLWLEVDPAKTLASSAGTPTLRACVPAAHGGPAGFAPFDSTPVDDDTILGYYGDVAADSGRPKDELFYVGNIYAPDGALGTSDGRTWGVLEIADVEADLPAYETVLDGDLTPITTDLPRNVTYQVFELAVQDSSTAIGWAASGHGAEEGYASSVAYDNLGNVFVGGTFADTINLGGTDYASNGNTDCYVAKYDENGSFQWAKTWGGTGADEVTCLLISEDSPLTLVIGGSFSGTVNFNPPGSPRTADFIDMYVLQLLTTNGSFAAVRTYGSPGYDVATSLADNGNRPEADYVLGGYISGETDFGGGFTLTPATSIQGVVVGLDRITGNAKSGYVLDSNDYSTVTDVAMFDDGQVAAGGVFAGTLFVPAGSEDAAGSTDGYCMRIALSTTPGMSAPNFLSGTGGAESDNIGGLLAFGSGSTASVIIALNTQDPEGDYAGIVAQLNMMPGPIFGFERVESVGGYYQINGLTAAPYSSPDAGTFYATGVKSGKLYFWSTYGPDPVILPGFADSGLGTEAFVWKFTSPAVDTQYFRTVWAREFGGPGLESGYAIAARDDAVAIAGVYNSSFDIAPGPQTANLPLLGAGEAFVTQLPSDGSW